MSNISRAACALAVLSFVVLPVSAQDARLNGHGEHKHLTLEAISPESTMLFASFAGIDACSKAAEDLGLYRLFADPQTQAFLGKLLEKYQEVAAQTPEEDQGQWDAIKSVLSGRIAVALTGLTISTEATIPVLPSAIVALDVGNNQDQAKGMLDQLLQEIQPMLDENGVTHEVKPFKGVDVHVYKVSLQGFDFAVCYAFLDNLMLASVGQGPIRKAINFSQRENSKTLATSAVFNRCRSKSKGKALLEFYTNIHAMTKRFKLLIPGEYMEQVEASGLGGASALYVASAVHDGDSFDTIYLDAPAPRKGLLALDNGKPLSKESFRLVPRDALAVVGLRCDLAKAWDTVWASFTALADPEMIEQGQSWIAMAEKEVGFRIREDILAALGEEMIVYAEMPRELRIPKIVASIGIRDREKAETLIGAMLTQVPVDFRTLKHGRHTIRMATPRGWNNFPGSPCYCLLEDRLLLSPTRSGIEEALDRLDNPQAESIAAASNFRETFGGMPWDRSSVIWWVDTKRALGFAYEAAYDVLPGIMPASMPMDIAQMPSLETFLRHVNSMGGVAWGDDDGIVFQNRTIGVASALAIAGRIVDRAPGAVPWVIKRMVQDFDGTFGGGAFHPGNGGGDAVESARPTNIVNPLSKDDPRWVELWEQVEAAKKSIANNPNSGSAHFALASAAHRVREFETALKHFKRAQDLDHNVPTTTYNIACTLSLLDRKEEALKWLQKALDEGFDGRGYLERDSDLNNIRGTEGFKKLLKRQK